MTDHATRYPASVVFNNKRNKVVVDLTFSIWIKISGYPQHKLVDKGGELDNTEFQNF